MFHLNLDLLLVNSLIHGIQTLLAGEHRLSEERLSCLSGRNRYLKSTPTLYMRNTQKNSVMKHVKIRQQFVIQTYWKVSLDSSSRIVL
jgi:hypothetical protein